MHPPAPASRSSPRPCASPHWPPGTDASAPARSRLWSTSSGWALCRELRPENVGLATGDTAVNRDAPVLCCTAEILANMALREGEDAPVDDVAMDELHWCADRGRGVAWQVPLLTLPRARFLLMSATLGLVAFFTEALTRQAAGSHRGDGDTATADHHESTATVMGHVPLLLATGPGAGAQ